MTHHHAYGHDPNDPTVLRCACGATVDRRAAMARFAAVAERLALLRAEHLVNPPLVLGRQLPDWLHDPGVYARHAALEGR